MKQYTTIKLRLHPSAEQAVLMEKTFGCCRWLWNRMLVDAGEFYAASDMQYIPTPAHYKKEAPFLREVDSQPLCCVHQNLRQAFLDFFRNPGVFQYPRFKAKKDRRDAFTVYCRQYRTGPSIRLLERGIRMPKLGLVPATVHRRPLHWWQLRSVTVTKSRSGKYFCSIVFGYEVKPPVAAAPAPERTLGLQYSPARFYVDSEGGSPVLPDLAKSKEKLARLQSGLSRMEPGSRHYQEQLKKIRLQHEHIANQRKDFIHKESRRIANAWEAVCVRDLDLRELSRKPIVVTDAGFGMFRECLRYKLERQGRACVTVDRYAPTARTCHVCGYVSGEPADRRWTCPACGAELSREVNAARNIRDFGLREISGLEAVS